MWSVAFLKIFMKTFVNYINENCAIILNENNQLVLIAYTKQGFIDSGRKLPPMPIFFTKKNKCEEVVTNTNLNNEEIKKILVVFSKIKKINYEV